jgi:hypothetical protein
VNTHLQTPAGRPSRRSAPGSLLNVSADTIRRDPDAGLALHGLPAFSPAVHEQVGL